MEELLPQQDDETRTNSFECELQENLNSHNNNKNQVHHNKDFIDHADIHPKLNSYRNVGRKMLSRIDQKALGVLKTLTPGTITDGCLVCCNAPACCPLVSICPCCGDPDYIRQKRQSSSYIYIRENSIEWNEPEVVIHPGVCCGVDPCLYDVQDRIQVVYFDDLVFERLTDQTRFCNECRTCCFGGKGERIRMDAPVCCGCCQRGSFPCICIPFCCPKSICPCILRFEVYVDDAQKGLYEIKRVRETAYRNDLYSGKKKYNI